MSDTRDSLDVLASLEECARLLDKDHPDLTAFRKALTTVRAQLTACKEAYSCGAAADFDEKWKSLHESSQ